MPKLSKTNSKVYGDEQGSSVKLFRERLMDRFAAHEWVRVINIDNEPFRWQYLPSHSEEFEFTPDPMKITRRGEIELYLLNSGESEVIIGENAYLMIENLYKKLVGKQTVARSPDTPSHSARAFNWADPQTQDEFIDKIYLGKESPTFTTPGKEHEDVPETPKFDKRKRQTSAPKTRIRQTS